MTDFTWHRDLDVRWLGDTGIGVYRDGDHWELHMSLTTEVDEWLASRDIDELRIRTLREYRQMIEAHWSVEPPADPGEAVRELQRVRLSRQPDGSYRLNGRPDIRIVRRRNRWKVLGRRRMDNEFPSLVMARMQLASDFALDRWLAQRPGG